MKLDILALGAHPDDVEMSCTGTLLAAMAAGKKVGIVDFTRGELGTRGTPEIRAAEAAASCRILGIDIRENLGLADGFFRNDREHQLPLIAALRRYQPDVVLANAISDRHPDHGRAAQLAVDACFLSGLRMIETFGPDGQPQAAWRPKNVYHYIQDRQLPPAFVVDIFDELLLIVVPGVVWAWAERPPATTSTARICEKRFMGERKKGGKSSGVLNEQTSRRFGPAGPRNAKSPTPTKAWGF